MQTIQRALLSVSDKTGLVPFAQALANQGIELLSTGGTAKALSEAGIQVLEVSDYTGSPEIMDGRVKTLHPRVHGGILMRDHESDRAALTSIGGRPIDLVVVNLYPFQKTVLSGAPHDTVIDNIDIGGPSMLRSAAKNHARVAVVVDPADYDRVLQAMASGTLDMPFRASLAQKAFTHTAQYDAAIAAYFLAHEGSANSLFPETLTWTAQKRYDLRYGENPHQQGAFYIDASAPAGSLARAESIGTGGKELSFNNFVDCDAAIECVREFEEPAAVIVKHANPCGVGTAETLRAAYRKAVSADGISAFGGIVALNREVDPTIAGLLDQIFLECIVAPSFSDEALAILRQKKNLRLLSTGPFPAYEQKDRILKRIGGGWVAQDRDGTGRGEVRGGKVVTQRVPTDDELRSLDFAWRVCKHVKSNAIVLSRGTQTMGIGAGQMSRVAAVEIAVRKAEQRQKGVSDTEIEAPGTWCALASDAFFPFPDGVEVAAKAGIRAIVQPGGSIKDKDVITAADAAGIAMIFTGVRHFRH